MIHLRDYIVSYETIKFGFLVGYKIVTADSEEHAADKFFVNCESDRANTKITDVQLFVPFE